VDVWFGEDGGVWLSNLWVSSVMDRVRLCRVFSMSVILAFWVSWFAWIVVMESCWVASWLRASSSLVILEVDLDVTGASEGRDWR